MLKQCFYMILVCLTVFGCSNPELELAQSRTKVTLKGEFLTTNPDVINFPIRIIFAIDCSGSMDGSDPEGLRFTAAQQFIEEHIDNESVEFGVILWSSTVVRHTGGFTRDLEVLNNVLSFEQNETQTNYSDAIARCQSYFLNEWADMYNTPSQVSDISRMKCVVLFFSDGLPNPEPSDRTQAEFHADLAGEVADMREELVENRGVGQFNFHTFLLSSLVSGTDAYPIAVNLLTNMASSGDGRFIEFTNANAIDFINIVDMRLTVEYIVKFIIAFNPNVRPGIEIVDVDSDGDGLTDAEEDVNGNGIVDVHPVTGELMETDSTLKDTDGDGLSDYFEVRLSEIDNALDPLNPDDSGCDDGAEEFDRDRDGLTDCEERIKGTTVNNPDTDYDGIPDGIEFYMGTNPLMAQETSDYDFDGFPDWLEVQRHTNVRANDEKIRERYSYRYDIADIGTIRLHEGTEYESVRRRISYTISNIDIMSTLASNGRDDGENLIRLFIAEVPEDMPESAPIYRVADVRVNYYDSEDRTVYVDGFEDL